MAVLLLVLCYRNRDNFGRGSPLAGLCDLAFLIYFSCQSMQESKSLETTSTKVCLNGNLLLSRWRMKTALIDIGKLILM